MASEAITQNDLREILSRTVGSIPSEFKKLLWTNPSPASSFSAQTISLNLSDYDCVEIETYLSPNGMTTTRLTEVGKMGEVGGLGSAGDRYARMATVSATGITFTEGKTNGTTNNAIAIPYKIYGIKYERVAPPQIDNTLEVASGTVDHSGFNAVTVAGASSSYKTISFGKTFSKIPQVVVQEHNNSLNNYGVVNTSVSYVTTTGFNLYVHGVAQATLSGLAYDWIAMTQTGE